MQGNPQLAGGGANRALTFKSQQKRSQDGQVKRERENLVPHKTLIYRAEALDGPSDEPFQRGLKRTDIDFSPGPETKDRWRKWSRRGGRGENKYD